MPVILCWIALFLPIATAPLAFMFFDNEMAIHSIGSHIYWHLRDKNLTKLVGDNNILESSLEFLLLHRSSRKIHSTLSTSRWSLFLLPTLVPVLGMFIWTVSRWGWWWKYLQKDLPINPWLIIAFGCFLWIIGFVALCLEVVAISWTFVKHDRFSDNVRGGIRHLLNKKLTAGPDTSANRDEASKTSLTCSFSPKLHQAEESAKYSLKFKDRVLVLHRCATDNEPERTVEVAVDEIEFIGIKRPPRVKRWRGKKPYSLFIDIKRGSNRGDNENFKRAWDCKGRRCTLYFERNEKKRAKALKEEYRRLASEDDH